MNGYITIGSLTDRSVEHIVRYCPLLEQLSLNLLSFTSTLDSLLELFDTPARALRLHTVSLSSFRNVSPRIANEESELSYLDLLDQRTSALEFGEKLFQPSGTGTVRHSMRDRWLSIILDAL